MQSSARNSNHLQDAMQAKQFRPIELVVGSQLAQNQQHSTCCQEMVSLGEVVGGSQPAQIQRHSSQENVPLASPFVDIGGRQFELGRELGRGNFGIVCEARERGLASGDSSVAVKSMRPKHSVTVAAATLECEVLRLITESLDPGSEVSRRVPQYIAHSIVYEPETVVLLAMSHVRGVALDFWLYGSVADRLPTIATEELISGPLPGSRLTSSRLATASDFARDLFLQLGEALAVLAGVVYHRDISAHNIMVDIVNDHPKFAIIDFGLAVKSGSWKDQWRSENLAGDPRYWAPANWMHFTYGCGYLEKHPDNSFCRQYAERLDHFSLGILGLEILFALWQGPDGDRDCGRSLAEALAAWHRYWAGVYALFQRFHSSFSDLRTEMVRSRCLLILLEDYRSLCSALHSAAVAGATLAQSSAATAAPVLLVAAELVDSHCSLSWEEFPKLLPGEVHRSYRGQLDDVQMQPLRA